MASLVSMGFRDIMAVTLLGLSVAMVHAAEPEKGQFEGLIKNSPFGSSAASGAQANAGATPLEFRGMFADQEEVFFSIYDTANRTSAWVGLKELGSAFSVQNYDPATQSVKVTYQNQTYTLTLKRAQVLVQAASGAQPAPMPQPGNGPAVGPTSGSPDEAARLALVAEEIRRRRALRTPSVQPPQPGAPTRSLPQPATK